MILGAIALMTLKSVSWKMAGENCHKIIAESLGDNGSGGDSGDFGIPLYNGKLPGAGS